MQRMQDRQAARGIESGCVECVLLMTSGGLNAIASKIARMAASTPGAGGPGFPSGITSAAAASRGRGTVTSFTPSTSEPSTQ